MSTLPSPSTAHDTPVPQPTRLLFRQRGVALITVLLIVFLATLAATSLVSLQQLAIRRSTLLQHQQQSRLYAFGAEQWAVAILLRDRRDNEVDHLDEDWATLPPALPIEGGQLTGQIEDLQGLFNLNNLLNRDCGSTVEENAEENTEETIDPDRLETLRRLLEILELDTSIAQAIADWLDPDQNIRFPDGAEDSDYLSLEPPYLVANNCLEHVSELRLIKGIDQSVYDKLLPYVTVLPSTSTPINVNTAPAPVLTSLDEELDLLETETLVEDRSAQHYDNVDAFLDATNLADKPELKDKLTIASYHFLIRVQAQVGEGSARLYSIVQRSDDDQPRILRRSFSEED